MLYITIHLQTQMVTHGKTDPLLDPLQFAYRANWSVKSGANMAFHFILQQWNLQEPMPGSYLWILATTFNTRQHVPAAGQAL